MWRNKPYQPFGRMARRKWEAFEVFCILVLLPLGLVLLARVALSQTLPSSHTITAQVVLCDTQEQAESIPTAHRDEGYFAATVQYMMLKQTINGSGEPTCSFGQWPMKVNKRVSMFTGLKFPPQDIEKTVYVLEVQVAGVTYYVLSQMDIDSGI